jgi:hypothetical protein
MPIVRRGVVALSPRGRCDQLAEEEARVERRAGRNQVGGGKWQKTKLILKRREEAERQDSGFVIVLTGLMTYLYSGPAYEIFRTGV